MPECGWESTSMLLPVSAVLFEAEEEKNIQPSDWLWSPAKLLSKCFFRLRNLLSASNWISDLSLSVHNTICTHVLYTNIQKFYCCFTILLLMWISSCWQKALHPQLLPKKRKHCNTNEMLEDIAIQLEKEDGRGHIKVQYHHFHSLMGIRCDCAELYGNFMLF